MCGVQPLGVFGGQWVMGDRKKKETQTRGGGADIMELALTY